jgi:hypothetical protein
MAKAKKLTNEELSNLQELNNEFNVAKNQLADIELNKMAVVAHLGNLRSKFSEIEQTLAEKYGQDSVINLQTGEVKPNGKDK